MIIFITSSIYFFNKIVDDIKERELSAIKRYGKFLEYISTSNESDIANIFVEDILIENNIIPVIITDDNFNIIEYKNLNESKIKKDSLYLANVLKKMKTQYEPITVNLSDLNRSIEKTVYFFQEFLHTRSNNFSTLLSCNIFVISLIVSLSCILLFK